MEIEYYNMEQLVKIVVKDKKDAGFSYYGDVKKSFCLWFFDLYNKVGYYDSFRSYYSKEGLESGQYHDVKFIVDDVNKKVYYRPYVSIIFTNDEANFYKIFDTFEEALAYGEEISKKYIKKLFVLK